MKRGRLKLRSSANMLKVIFTGGMHGVKSFVDVSIGLGIAIRVYIKTNLISLLLSISITN